MSEHTADYDAQVFADKLFEWLADFKVENASERARLVAGSFIREGWTRVTPPGEGRAKSDVSESPLAPLSTNETREDM